MSCATRVSTRAHPSQSTSRCIGGGGGRRLLPTLPPVRENALDERDIGELLRVCA